MCTSARSRLDSQDLRVETTYHTAKRRSLNPLGLFQVTQEAVLTKWAYAGVMAALGGPDIPSPCHGDVSLFVSLFFFLLSYVKRLSLVVVFYFDKSSSLKLPIITIDKKVVAIIYYSPLHHLLPFSVFPHT